MTNIQDIISLEEIDLLIFDLDGTLTEYKTNAILPGVAEYFTTHSPRIALAIASNHGGVGLRYWMEQKTFGDPSNYPTAKSVEHMIETLCNTLQQGFDVYVSYSYVSQKGIWSPIPPEERANNRWSPKWRKPAAGMLEAAIHNAETVPHRTIMIGDWDEDRQAAKAAGCLFLYAYQFFGRERPEEE